jgi:hypothetical protein
MEPSGLAFAVWAAVFAAMLATFAGSGLPGAGQVLTGLVLAFNGRHWVVMPNC